MVQKIMTATVIGIAAELITVEADVTNGLPTTIIVGLPDTAVQESRERVRSAIKHTQFSYPQTRVSINLAPGDVPKVGTHFDLPIALSVLLAAQLVVFDASKKLFIGELSLDGTVRPCKGVLAMVLAAHKAGYQEVYVPMHSAQEAALVKDVIVYGVETLQQVVMHLRAEATLSPVVFTEQVIVSRSGIDFAMIAGQSLAKRALEIAAAGNHNVRMVGPPGSGKTMLVKAFAGILPPLEHTEMLEITNIHSIAGRFHQGVVGERPVRSPHHTMSATALIGGGGVPRPGEVTLAHKGVLFLDEFPEFSRGVLEVLRQPLEDRVVTISRARTSLTFPAEFILVAAQNPCPCGNYGDLLLNCTCMPVAIQKYNRKISGPLLDRIDLHITVPRLGYKQMMEPEHAESSESIKQRVVQARKMQYERFGEVKTNNSMSSEEVKQFCALDAACSDLLRKATSAYALSGRSIHRVLKVARTIADLNNEPAITLKALSESLQYRFQNAS